MSLYATYETDKTAEQEGTPVQFAANEDRTVPTFYLARASRVNKDWSKEFDRLTRDSRFVTKIRLNEMKSADWELIAFETFLKASLKGWQHVQDREGKNMAFNYENAKQLLEDLPDLYTKLQEYAGSADTFRKANQEIGQGN